MTRQEWLEDHFDGEPKPINGEGKRWMRKRPASVQALMKRFPPSCLVRVVKIGTCCKDVSIEDVGLVRMYYETVLGPGFIGVAFDSSETIHKVPPDALELVRCWNGLTPEAVEEILK